MKGHFSEYYSKSINQTFFYLKFYHTNILKDFSGDEQFNLKQRGPHSQTNKYRTSNMIYG